ncbi:endocuticle structural glycoprotein SgAbd-8-like [Anoplophora glabripennis]|uniref:endocuticle structural glycoprotein SgAbd-8-like n=1 Tax=Anoplophora glabripennis TaxID=217634 RepID=UPI00087518E8|nr:endocuticle structural glycoprotein SgAbd-8-like [Anoplophora glabripennis]
MKIAIIAFAFLASASAASLTGTEPVPILRQEADVGVDGGYHFSYETGNGITAEELGVLKNTGVPDVEAEEVAGSVSYTAPDGTPIKLSYVANEFGFQPSGDHLPVAPVDDNTPPPIPPAIQRALEYIAAHPEKLPA